MTTTTNTCQRHREVGYAYSYQDGRSRLVCRACGQPDTTHETIMQTIRRLVSEEGK